MYLTDEQVMKHVDRYLPGLNIHTDEDLEAARAFIDQHPETTVSIAQLGVLLGFIALAFMIVQRVV